MGCQNSTGKVASPETAKKTKDVQTVSESGKTVEDNKADDITVKEVEPTPTADVETVKPSGPEAQVNEPTESGQEYAALTVSKEDSTAQNAEEKDDAKVRENEQNGVGVSTGEQEIFAEKCTTPSVDQKLTENKVDGTVKTTQETCTSALENEPKVNDPEPVQNSSAEETVKVFHSDDKCVGPPTPWGASLFGGCCYASVQE